jgi:hypothetical protein
MKQIPLYSLVIFPNSEQSALIKSYKQLLKDHIGWFGSANATARITVINFENELSLQLHLEKIREFCKKKRSTKSDFKRLGFFWRKYLFYCTRPNFTRIPR